MKQYSYSLAKKGKWICPMCGKKTFVCYVDGDGNILDESVGKCDRADNCAYHKPPKEYFKEHRLIDVRVPERKPKHTYKPQPQPSYIDPTIFKKSVTATKKHENHLMTYLASVFGQEYVDKMIADYYIGTSKHWNGSTVFWQIDRLGRVRGGKVMQYDPTTGKRVKEPINRITWVHKAMSLPNYNLAQCMFGEHLLEKNPDKTVIIVESEKTAIIASSIFNDAIVLACGGCGNLTSKMCKPLRGRDVVLLPDNGKFEEWSIKGKCIRYIFKQLRIADIMEKKATLVGDDIGDYFLEHCYELPSDLDFGLHTL